MRIPEKIVIRDNSYPWNTLEQQEALDISLLDGPVPDKHIVEGILHFDFRNNMAYLKHSGQVYKQPVIVEDQEVQQCNM